MGSQEAHGLLWGVEPKGWASHESNHSPLFRAMMEATDIGAGHSSALMEETGGPFRLSAPGVLEEGFASAGIAVSRSGDVNCPFEYGSWHEFWRGTRAAGPTQMAIGRAGLEAVEAATRDAVEPLTSEAGSIAFETNVFIHVVGQA